MAVKHKTATLRSGQVSRLAVPALERCTVVITAPAEDRTIKFQTRTFGGFSVSDFFPAEQVSLAFRTTVPFAVINGTTPDNVQQLEISYDVRTRGDA